MTLKVLAEKLNIHKQTVRMAMQGLVRDGLAEGISMGNMATSARGYRRAPRWYDYDQDAKTPTYSFEQLGLPALRGAGQVSAEKAARHPLGAGEVGHRQPGAKSRDRGD